MSEATNRERAGDMAIRRKAVRSGKPIEDIGRSTGCTAKEVRQRLNDYLKRKQIAPANRVFREGSFGRQYDPSKHPEMMKRIAAQGGEARNAERGARSWEQLVEARAARQRLLLGDAERIERQGNG